MEKILRYAHNEGHTDVCYSEDGKVIITCGSDGDMRSWSEDFSEDPKHTCVGESAFAVRVGNEKIYVSSGSNDIQILAFPSGDREGILARFPTPVNSIAVSKDGGLIALATDETEVKLVHTKDGNRISAYEGLKGPCLSVAISANSDFLAASSGDGFLRIWNIETRALVKEISCGVKANSFENAKALCRPDFSPKNCMAYPDHDRIRVLDSTKNWNENMELWHKEINDSFSIVQFSHCGLFLAGASIKGDICVWNVLNKDPVYLFQHQEKLIICGLAWHPSSVKKLVFTDREGYLGVLQIEGKVAEDSNGDENNIFDDVDFQDEDFIKIPDNEDDDNENAISLSKLKKQYGDEPDPELADLASVSSRRSPTPRPRTPETPLQEAFMPSSTPVHLNPRYLCWNEVGIIKSYSSFVGDDDDSSKSIEVEFHDANFHNSIMLRNFEDYTLGSLSSTNLSVANDKSIKVIPLSSTMKEWTVTLDMEEIVLIASSENLVCLGLSNYLLRIYSTFGTQMAVVSIPGPLVCLSARNNCVLAAYHLAGARKSDQVIGVKLVRMNGFQVEGHDLNSSLTPEASLAWIGFSDAGTPLVMDSSGLLCCNGPQNKIWIPICDTSKHSKSPADSFFVTSVCETSQSIVGIKCKGTSYPSITPRPTMCELQIQPPFLNLNSDKDQMESELFACSNLKITSSEKKIKETALKCFALSCKGNFDQRGIELMEMLANPQIINLAIKYASKLDKRKMAEKLMEIAASLNDDQDEPFATSFTTDFAPLSTPSTNITPTNMRLSLKPKLKTKNANTPVVSETKVVVDENLTPNAADNSQFNETLSLFTPTQESEVTEKRKQPDSETEKPKEKVRRLDRFKFGKRT